MRRVASTACFSLIAFEANCDAHSSDPAGINPAARFVQAGRCGKIAEIRHAWKHNLRRCEANVHERPERPKATSRIGRGEVHPPGGRRPLGMGRAAEHIGRRGDCGHHHGPATRAGRAISHPARPAAAANRLGRARGDTPEVAVGSPAQAAGNRGKRPDTRRPSGSGSSMGLALPG